MDEINWSEFKRQHLIDVWRALPDGCRLRVRIYSKAWRSNPSDSTATVAPQGDLKSPAGISTFAPEHFSPAFDEARVLAYANRLVYRARQKGNEVLVVVSPVDDPEISKTVKVPCWDW